MEFSCKQIKALLTFHKTFPKLIFESSIVYLHASSSSLSLWAWCWYLLMSEIMWNRKQECLLHQPCMWIHVSVINQMGAPHYSATRGQRFHREPLTPTNKKGYWSFLWTRHKVNIYISKIIHYSVSTVLYVLLMNDTAVSLYKVKTKL